MALIVWVLLIALCSCCVESTMRSAYERGYEVVTLTDCLAATRCGGDLGYESSYDAGNARRFGIWDCKGDGKCIAQYPCFFRFTSLSCHGVCCSIFEGCAPAVLHAVQRRGAERGHQVHVPYVQQAHA